MADLIGHLTDTDIRGIWVHADDGAVRLDFGTVHGTAGYRLFLTRADAEQLAGYLDEASDRAHEQQKEADDA